MNGAAGNQRARLTGSIFSAAACLCQLEVQWITFLMLLSSRFDHFSRERTCFTSKGGGLGSADTCNNRGFEIPFKCNLKRSRRSRGPVFLVFFSFSTWLGSKHQLTARSTPQIRCRKCAFHYTCTAGYKPAVPERDSIFFLSLLLFK